MISAQEGILPDHSPAASKAVKAMMQISTNQAGRLSDRLRGIAVPILDSVELAIAKPLKLVEQFSNLCKHAYI